MPVSRLFPRAYAARLARRIGLLLVVAILLIGPNRTIGVAEARTGAWYVANTGNDANDCATVATPCETISSVLAKPGFTAGDTVQVALGVYRNDSAEAISITRDAILSGGWEVNFTRQTGRSILEGAGGVQVAQGVTAKLNSFEIAGHEFEGIRNLGSLSVEEVRVSSKLSNGLFNSGRMSVTHSQFDSSYKNGVINEGTLVLTSTAILRNGRSGILNTGVLTLTQTTIRDHNLGPGCNGINNQNGSLYMTGSAVLDNGSIYPAAGAGVCNSGKAILANSLISGNHSSGEPGGGGIYNSQGHLALYNVTLIRNSAVSGGGIYNNPGTGSVYLQNSLVADNSALQGQDCYGGVQSLGYNLIGNPAGCNIHPAAGDLLSVPSQVFPPIGEQLFAPLARSSPAVDAGNPVGCSDGLGGLLARDQRSIARLGRCDIGAYEYDPAQDPLHYYWMPFAPLIPFR